LGNFICSMRNFSCSSGKLILCSPKHMVSLGEQRCCLGVKAHYTKPKLTIQSPFLESKSSDFKKKHLKWCWSSHFFPFPSLYHHNLNIFLKTFKNMGLEKVNLDIEMEFTNLKFSFQILKCLKKKNLFHFFILSVMVLQCVVAKICRFSFQLHWKGKSP
jgi:hypothetical protein